MIPLDPEMMSGVQRYLPGGVQADNLPTISKGGMFGGGGDWRKALLAAAAGFMARRSPQVSANIFNGLQARQQQTQAEEQYQRRRADENTDWQTHYDYEAAHPKTPNNDTANDYAFWQQHLSPEQFNQWLENRINPPQYMNVPGVGLVQVPRQGVSQVPDKPVGKLTPLGAGGPSPGGSGGFP